MKCFVLLMLMLMLILTSCASVNDAEGSYLRVSHGSFGAKLLQWLGLATEGEYCQISSNEEDYVWTVEDLAFFKDQCPADSERLELLRQALE